MITNTFLHFKGIGKSKETDFWNESIYNWGDLMKKFSLVKKPSYKNIKKSDLQKSFKSLKTNDIKYFAERLPISQYWRLFREFKRKCLYLDIETTGSNKFPNEITTISTYDGKKIKYYVNGINLEEFKNNIFDYKLLITYNGRSFDIPFIERYFDINLDLHQIDLRYVFKSLDFKGGLKLIEKNLGIDRQDLNDLNGFFAIHLWNEYSCNNNKKALNTLIAYNIEDTINLETLMHIGYNLKVRASGFQNFKDLEIPTKPKHHLFPDNDLIRKLKMEIMNY